MDDEEAPVPIGITSEVHGSTIVVAVAGELDMASQGQLVAAVAEQSDRHRVTRVIVDLVQLEFMDSTGLHEIGLLDAAAARKGTTISVHGARPSVRRVFAAGGLCRVLDR